MGVERNDRAADLMTDICQRERVAQGQVILHSDNGSPMKGASLLAILQGLGVMPSYSRSSVSNDNPYSEFLFRTLKYRPEYPEHGFADLQGVRTWVTEFVDWYNTQHLHSSIKLVTPQQRHSGEDKVILVNRKNVYQQTEAKNPIRWSGEIRNWDPITKVHLNPEKRKTRRRNF